MKVQDHPASPMTAAGINKEIDVHPLWKDFREICQTAAASNCRRATAASSCSIRRRSWTMGIQAR
jgi:hypothetical protein